jgi:hypothetical protein
MLLLLIINVIYIYIINNQLPCQYVLFYFQGHDIMFPFEDKKAFGFVKQDNN